MSARAVLVDGLPETYIVASLVADLACYHVQDYGLGDNKPVRVPNLG